MKNCPIKYPSFPFKRENGLIAQGIFFFRKK